MKYEKSCGAVVFSQLAGELSVLLIQHKLGGHWAFPKGHVEENETEYQTAHREVLEETGVEIEIKDGKRYENTYNPAKHITKTVVYFVAEAKNTTPVAQPEEIRNTEFIGIDRAEQILTYANDKKMLKDAALFYLSE